jgi:crotonobetainyl-CoA:carnitine CoA-transferase CaiB-like acyl-CoA transferase
MRARWNNYEELTKIISTIIASKDMQEWETIFRKNSLIYGRCATPLEVSNDPQAIANEFFTDLCFEGSHLKLVNSPVKFYPNESSIRTPAPELGQHTEDVLQAIGYTKDDISILREKKVIL